MDCWLARHRTARMLSTCLPLIFEAAEYAREAHLLDLRTELQDLAEDLIKLHRDALQLPPQRSTCLQDREEDVPW